jgi:hypothetical protein
MNFPEVKMKVLLYGEREGFTSGGNGGIGGVLRRKRHPQGLWGVGLMEIAPTAQPGISLARKAGREWVTPRQ